MPPEELPSPVWETPGMFPVLEDDSKPFWNYVDLLLFLGLLIGAFILILCARQGWVILHPNLRHDPLALALPVQCAFYIAIYFCFRVLFKLRYGRYVFASLGWRKTNVSPWAMAAGGVVLAFSLSATASLVHTPKVATPFDKLADTPWDMFFLAVTAVILAPLFEEMFFRGFLQPLLSKTLGMVAGVLLTGIFFGALHAAEYMQVWQYVAAIAIVGIVLGAVRAKTNSIIPGTVMHGCFNAVAIVGLIATKYAPHK